MAEHGNLLNSILNIKQQFHEATNGPSEQEKLKAQNIQIVGALCIDAFNAAVEIKDKKLIFLLKDVCDWYSAIAVPSNDFVKQSLVDVLFLQSIDKALRKASLLALKSASHSPQEREWTKKTANEKLKPIIRKYANKDPLKLTVRFLHEKSGIPKSTIANTDIWDDLKSIKEDFRNEKGKPSIRSQRYTSEMDKFAEQRPSGKMRINTKEKYKE